LKAVEIPSASAFWSISTTTGSTLFLSAIFTPLV
jgi:hypothetical protein